MIFQRIINFFKRLFCGKPKKLPPPPGDETKGQDPRGESGNENGYIMETPKKQNGSASATPNEFLYLYKLIRWRVCQTFKSGKDPEKGSDKDPEKDIKCIEEPKLSASKPWQKPFADFVEKHKLNDDEVVLLLIGLAPYREPHLIGNALKKELLPRGTDWREYQYMGGVKGHNSGFFLPTGETALFLIAGDDSTKRIEVQELFGAEHMFWEKKILWLEDMQEMDPPMNGKIIMAKDYFDLLTTGTHKSPQFSISFPAKKIASGVEIDTKYPVIGDPCVPGPRKRSPWDQLVINDDLKGQIDEIRTWLKYNDQLIKELNGSLQFRKGYRTLFYGPPGSGKTLTAQLLGKELKKDVFKIDLSMVVSKYIGETEKNLEQLFAKAEDKNWILFFDEADALFGKRTNVRDAHDKYANQEVSYLLQRIEDYNGLIILATNMKNNVDDAFVRRFNSILKFPFPNIEERKQIWVNLFPDNAEFRESSSSGKDQPIDIPERVKIYELTGGNINNVVHYACLKAMERRDVEDDCDCFDKKIEKTSSKLLIYLDDVLNGIKREFGKEGKPFST